MIDISQKKFLIYDFDQTIDTLHIDWSDWRSGIAKIFLKYDPNSTYDPSQSSFAFQNHFIKENGTAIVKELHKFSREYEGSHYLGHTPNQGLVDFIKKIAQEGEKKQFVWTSNNSKTVLPVIKELGLEGFFEKVVARDTVNFMKPSHEGFMEHIFIKDTDLADYVLVGDNNHSDGEAAKTAGIDYIHVNDFMKMI